jgi:universal stress protein A
MSGLGKLLVAVDFSAEQKATLALAVTLARPFAAAIELFHVWTPPPLFGEPLMVWTAADAPPISLEDLARQRAGVQMLELVDELHRAGCKQVHATVAVGDAADQICAHAGKSRPDLIVMGTRGRTGLAHVLLGSVAERVVRHAPCPVVTVRASR